MEVLLVLLLSSSILLCYVVVVVIEGGAAILLVLYCDVGNRPIEIRKPARGRLHQWLQPLDWNWISMQEG